LKAFHLSTAEQLLDTAGKHDSILFEIENFVGSLLFCLESTNYCLSHLLINSAFSLCYTLRLKHGLTSHSTFELTGWGMDVDTFANKSSTVILAERFLALTARLGDFTGDALYGKHLVGMSHLSRFDE